MTRRKHLKRRVRDRSAKTGERYAAALRHIRARTEENHVPSTDVADEMVVTCSFCNKTTKMVKKLIAGPGVYICDECIGLCNNILNEEPGGDDHDTAPSLEDSPVERLISIFRGMAGTNKMMEENLARWARRLHSRGVSARRLAVEAGVSEEDVKARFGL